MFKVGDRVVCQGNWYSRFTLGCVYQVIAIDREYSQGRPYVLNMMGDDFYKDYWVRASMFKLHKESKVK